MGRSSRLLRNAEAATALFAAHPPEEMTPPAWLSELRPPVPWPMLTSTVAEGRALQGSIGIDPESLPARLEDIPGDAPGGRLEIVAGDGIRVAARLKRRSYKEALKTIKREGFEAVGVRVFGFVRVLTAPGEPIGLESAGIQAFVKDQGDSKEIN